MLHTAKKPRYISKEKRADFSTEMVVEIGSALFASGSFTDYHFELYDIYPSFLFTLRTVQREFYKGGIFIDFSPCLAPADRTVYPPRAFLIVVHFMYLRYGRSSVLNIRLLPFCMLLFNYHFRYSRTAFAIASANSNVSY